MRNLLIFLFVIVVSNCRPAEEPPAAEPEPEAPPEEAMSLDSVDVNPDIATVELENDWVRIIRTKTPAGHTMNRHTHGPGVSVALTDNKSRATYDDGEVNEGETSAGDIGGSFDAVLRPHVTENVSGSDTEAVFVELEIEGGEPREPPSHDAVQVDPEHHTVELENDLVRVVRMNYPEGYQTPPHNHYPGVNITLAGETAESAPEGVETEPAEIEVGGAGWNDGYGDPHVTKNLGGEMHIVRVELKVR